MEGYIKLYRKLEESPVFQNEKLLKVWIWCLFRANHKDTETIVGFQKITLHTGQFIFGLLKASTELQVPKSTLHRYMKMLEKLGMIGIEPGTKFSIVTVENWAKYQTYSPESGNQKGTEIGNKRETSGKQVGTDKNDKNDKNDKKVIYTSEYQDIVDSYNRICVSLPKVKKLSPKRKTCMAARYQEGYHIEDFEAVFRKAEKSDFLSGRKTEWHAGFDWLINENNMLKVLEGNYDNKKDEEKPVARKENHKVDFMDL